MRGLGQLISKLVFLCAVHYSKAVINVTLTGTTTRHVCKGEDIDFKWTYDDNNPDKNYIATIQWSKDPSGYLIMQYKEEDNPKLSITSSPNDYSGRVQRTTEAGSNDIGMRLKQSGSTAVDDDGKYYVSLIVDKDPGDANDYFVPYRDPQGVQVYVCVGVDDTYPLPSLVLRYDESTNTISCTGPTTLGDTTFAIFDPSENIIVNSTTDTTIETTLATNRPGGTYRCKTYCTQQGYGDTPQGTCLPTDATLVLPDWTTRKVTPPPTVVPQRTPVPQSVITVTNDETTTMVDIISTVISTDVDVTPRIPITTQDPPSTSTTSVTAVSPTMRSVDDWCSSPIEGGCLAVIIVIIVFLCLVVIYVLVLVCYTFCKGAHGYIPTWLKVILIVLTILVPLIGAIIAVVYVYKKHCGVKTTDKVLQEHSVKYFIFKCPCKFIYQPYEVNKDKQRGRTSPCSPSSNKVQQDPSHAVHSDPTKPSAAPLNYFPPDKPAPPVNPSVTLANETYQKNHTGSGGGIRKLPPIERVDEEGTVELEADASHKKKKRKSKKSKKKREDFYQDNINYAFDNNQDECT